MRYLGALAAVLLAAACAGGPAPRSTSASGPRVIDTAELQASAYATAFDAVQALRPQWLRARGRTSLTQQEFVKVYLDNSLMGGPEQLRSITLKSVSTIRYLDGVEATQRWGLDHGQGAISVSTRREPKE